MTQPSTRGRLESLDALRGIAVLLVIFRHATYPTAEVHPIVAAPFAVLHQIGWVGVDIFFVLSGFLVSGLLFNEYKRYGTIDPKRFLIRRGLKIYPSFYVLLTATVLVWWLYDGGFGRDFWPWFLSEFFYVQNYGPAHWIHTWSLAVEEHFYFLLTFLVWISVRRKSSGEDPFRFLVPGVFGTALVALLLRTWIGYTEPFDFKTHVFASHIRMDALGFGVVLSYWYHFHEDRTRELSRRWRGPLTLAGLGLLTPVFLGPLESTPFIVGPGFLMISLGTMGLLAAMVCGSDDPRGKVPRGVGWISRIGIYSYSVYLWHVPARDWFGLRIRTALIEPLLGESTLSHVLNFSIYAALSIAMGIGFARIIEFPVLKFRDRFFPSRSRKPTAVEEEPAVQERSSS